MVAVVDSTRICGAMTALVTPFRGGEVDWPTLDMLVDRQVAGGIDWLVPCGTTGETPTLSEVEYEAVIEAVVARSNGRCPVMAGTGSNNTAEAIRRTRFAAKARASAVLIVTPYYNRPTQEGLFRHYAAIAEAVDIPIVLYNVPIRTGVSISTDTVVRLREAFPKIAAIKHATGTLDGVTELVQRSDITVLSGDDPLTWPMMAIGAEGVISTVSNLVPAMVKNQVTAARSRNTAESTSLHRRVHELSTNLGAFGPNPIPIKTAMAMAGLIQEEFRLPLCPLDAESRRGIERILRRYELLGALAA
ncbi:MAG: 4-hydroxy-tetrahydrodipicolinate synthase [Planctomycetota bacterium]